MIQAYGGKLIGESCTNDTIMAGMTRKNLSPLMSFALLLGGCPNRQTAPRVVYVPRAATASAIAAPKSSGDLLIEEPPPPQPEGPPAEAQPQESTTQKPPLRPRRRAAPAETPVEVPAPPPEAVSLPAPALETHESPQQQSELRTRVVQMQESVRARINALGRTSMASLDRKTLEGARMFLVQSERARDSNDLQRAFNLARKASLLVDALEQKP